MEPWIWSSHFLFILGSIMCLFLSSLSEESKRPRLDVKGLDEEFFFDSS